MQRFCSALAVVALAACDRPQALVICHNSNCTSPDVARDDTIEALTDGLALRYQGRPALDGIEIDTFWHGTRSVCLFAHDLSDTTVTAVNAAQAIGDYLAQTAQPSWNGERFYFFVELKATVGSSYTDRHSPQQLVDHAECGLDVLDVVVAGARAGGHQLTVGFLSSSPALIATIAARPRWQAAPDLELLLIADIFAPYSDAVPELSDFKTELDAVEYHPDFMNEVRRETYRSLGLDLIQWSFVTTTEALDAITHWEPRYVFSNEAVLLRRWMER